MDVWVIAAAAGAGYVAERLKNLTRGKHGPQSGGSIEVQGKSFHFHRLSGNPLVEAMCREKESAFQDASTSGHRDENFVMLDNSASHSTISNSSVRFRNGEDIRGDWEARVSLDFDSVNARGLLLPQPSSREVCVSYEFRGNRSSLRSRRLKSKFIKPRSSLESCLVAQLCREYSEIEEYTYCKHPREKPTLRPFVVTDGSKIINRRSHESFMTGEENRVSQKDVYMQDCTGVLGVPRLPDIVTADLQKKAKAGTGKQRLLRRKSREMDNQYHNNAQGSFGGVFIFYLGLTTGIISSFIANKRETEKLNKLLKQSENLVQDLHEELEMKDSLTVKELEMEDFESHNVHNASHCDNVVQASSPEQKLGCSSRDSREELCHQKPGEDSMSQIEAELEAELERLESNINSSRLEQKISNMAEQHPEFVSDVVVGELKADLFGAKTGTQPYADRHGSGSSTPHSVRYPVDPRELSLRLHEVIQSRLEERINELEAQLRNSQRKSMEYANTRPRDYGTGSPVVRDEQPVVDQPVVINLSGEALSAYNEAYEEFNKFSDSDEEEPNDHQAMFHEHKQVMHSVQNGGLNSFVMQSTDETPQTEISYGMRGDHDDDDEDENEDSDDEMERLLIRQIVEKARQGSPALLKAQRSLLLNDE